MFRVLRLLLRPSHDLQDLRAWRTRVLDTLLTVLLLLGSLIALPSAWLAWRNGLWPVPVMDASLLGLLALLRWRSNWPLAGRAYLLMGLVFVLGMGLVALVGPVNLIYLMVVPALAVLLCGMRTAALALLLNVLGLVTLGGLAQWLPLPGLSSVDFVTWLVMIANFCLADGTLVLAIAALLAGLESALASQLSALSAMRNSQAQLKAAAEAHRVNEESFRRIAAQMPGVIYQLRMKPDGSYHFLYVSPGVRELYGIEPEQVILDSQALARFRHPDDRDRVLAQMQASRAAGLDIEMEYRIVLADGTEKWIHLQTSSAQQDEHGMMRYGLIVDITERKRTEARLRENEERWKLALESTGDGVWDWHLQTGVEIFSRRFREMYGYSEAELPNRADAMDGRTHPDDLASLERAREDHFAGRTASYVHEHRVRCKDGSWKWVMSRGMVIARDEQGRPLRMIGTHTDITRWKESEALIWQQAHFDALTGLPNRRMLRDRLEQSLARAAEGGQTLALMFIDLDHFKEVNDTLGHAQGDELLLEAARRIGACLGPKDTVARMGGDEFTVVLPAMQDAARAEAVAQQLIHSLSTPFQLGHERAFISASIGIACYPADAQVIDELLKHADQALYAAKDGGRNRFSHFTPALQEAAQTRMRLATDLRSALAEAQFRVHYQPIVDLATGEVHKAEALVRWQHPQRGLVSPGLFVPIAEASGVIVELGDWVFRQAVQQVAAWRVSHDPRFQISVNKSPVQFRSAAGTAQAWARHLADQGLPGECVVVEITEGLLLEADSHVFEQLAHLKQAGMPVSLDDFGTGYSSLSYLQKFDIDFLKIDQVFVRGLSATSKNIALCKAIIGMAHELGMKVVAEGVETEEQRQLLQAAGCDYGQGYLFARPMDGESLSRWLAETEGVCQAK